MKTQSKTVLNEISILPELFLKRNINDTQMKNFFLEQSLKILFRRNELLNQHKLSKKLNETDIDELSFILENDLFEIEAFECLDFEKNKELNILKDETFKQIQKNIKLFNEKLN